MKTYNRFLSVELSKKLKQVGYNDNTLASYEDGKLLICQYDNTLSFERSCELNSFPAILYDDAIDWLLENKNTAISTIHENGKVYLKIGMVTGKNSYNTRKEALDSAINKMVDYIIEMKY